jgi:hypothetical protein
MVRVPTTNALSSTKKLGLWLGAALAGVLIGRRDAEEYKQAWGHPCIGGEVFGRTDQRCRSHLAIGRSLQNRRHLGRQRRVIKSNSILAPQSRLNKFFKLTSTPAIGPVKP